MKPFLMFAGSETANAGVKALVGDFDSVADAFLSLIDSPAAHAWWHVLDTGTGEVVDRRHVRVSNGVISFQRSEWVVGSTARPDAPAQTVAISAPKAALTGPQQKAAALSGLEADLRSVVAAGIKNGSTQQGGSRAPAER